MSLFDRVADLSLVVEDSSRERRSQDTSSGFTRVTTVFSLHGDGVTGRGEDVTYDTEDHDALAEAPAFDLAGEYTLASFSATLDDVDLFPTKAPERETAHHYRRWGLESAALDLALRQNETNLGAAVGRTYDPVRFVVSTRLGESPSTDRVDAILARHPDAEFKLDPTTEWTDALVEELAATDAVRVLDLKGHYQGTEVDSPPDPVLYDRVVHGFPEAVIEDPAMTEDTALVVENHLDRVSWDAPITSVDDVEALPFPPRWLNVKPSRFGTVQSVLETIEYCERNNVQCYGGGQFELDVGREQIQALASLFYPDGPNDVAPPAYNEEQLPDDLPTSPIEPPAEPVGFCWS